MEDRCIPREKREKKMRSITSMSAFLVECTQSYSLSRWSL